MFPEALIRRILRYRYVSIRWDGLVVLGRRLGERAEYVGVRHPYLLMVELIRRGLRRRWGRWWGGKWAVLLTNPEAEP